MARTGEVDGEDRRDLTFCASEGDATIDVTLPVDASGFVGLVSDEEPRVRRWQKHRDGHATFEGVREGRYRIRVHTSDRRTHEKVVQAKLAEVVRVEFGS